MECLMDHIVLNMDNDEKMIAFYADVLGLATERLAEYREGRVPFPSVRLNAETIIDLFPQRLWSQGLPAGPGRENLNHFCMAMDRTAWEDLRARLTANRVAIEQGPVPRWGAGGTGISIYFRDPQGNLIEARYYEGREGAEKCLLES